MTAFEEGASPAGKSGTAEIHSIPRFAPADPKGRVAPHCRRSDVLGLTSQIECVVFRHGLRGDYALSFVTRRWSKVIRTAGPTSKTDCLFLNTLMDLKVLLLREIKRLSLKGPFPSGGESRR